jgi:ElaB/YqjD/DUF883 family membrane-anchored ribosome-binding protein
MRNAVLAFEMYRDMKAARKMVRKGWRTAGAFADEAAAYVKKGPFKFIGLAFGMAFGLGAAAGWLISRK